jgi:hypothetical protein
MPAAINGHDYVHGMTSARLHTSQRTFLLRLSPFVRFSYISRVTSSRVYVVRTGKSMVQHETNLFLHSIDSTVIDFAYIFISSKEKAIIWKGRLLELLSQNFVRGGTKIHLLKDWPPQRAYQRNSKVCGYVAFVVRGFGFRVFVYPRFYFGIPSISILSAAVRESAAQAA